MTSIQNWREQRPTLKSIATALMQIGLLGIFANTIIWFAANTLGDITLPLIAVIITTVMSVVIGGLLYLALSRFFAHANTNFTVICVIFLLAYAYLPISAMSIPPPNMDVFNVRTVVAAEMMHLVTGALAIWGYAKRTHP